MHGEGERDIDQTNKKEKKEVGFDCRKRLDYTLQHSQASTRQDVGDE
jgi:hypothetical protein